MSKPILTLVALLWSFDLRLYALDASAINSFELSNGMKVLTLEDHSLPNANMYTFWKVGSRNEAPGITGLSHFFEHMMFNGSKNFPPGSFDKVMEASGGSNNAYTTENLTVYTNWFPTSALSTILDLEVDRIAQLTFDDKIIESEREVVLSERSTSLENSSWEMLIQSLRDVAFSAHPYSWPVIGWESDIRAWTKQDLITYFKTHYDPANALMVFVGDFDNREIQLLIQKKFAAIPHTHTSPNIRTIEPTQLGEKRVEIRKISNPNPLLIMGYHVPSSKDRDYYALALLAEILTGGSSSRLHRQLVDEKNLASNVDAHLPLSFDPELFTIALEGMTHVPLQKMEEALDNEIENLKHRGVTALELEKAKNKRIMALYREQETINGKAELIGQYELFFGSYRQLFEASDRYKAVTAKDIQAVLKKYFLRTNRTIGTQPVTHSDR